MLAVRFRGSALRPRDLSGPEDLAGLEALGADVQPLRDAADHGSDSLDVRGPTPVRAAVRVAHLHPETGLPSTDLANGCHIRWIVTEDAGYDFG